MGRKRVLLHSLVVGKRMGIATRVMVLEAMRFCPNSGIISLIILLDLHRETCVYVATLFETATGLEPLFRRLIDVASPMRWGPGLDPW